MKISAHADHTERLCGIRAEDIHKWIDGFFEAENLGEFLGAGQPEGYDPYHHRKFRHCQEALEDAWREFEGQYTREQIKAVFEQHLRDDYNGYLPRRDDFANGTFKVRYHESGEDTRKEPILSPVELNDYFKGKAYQQRKAERKKGLSGFHLNIVLPTAMAVVLFVASIFVVEIPVFRGIMTGLKKEMIRELTLAAASIADRYIEQEKAGLLTRAEAQEKALADIGVMRYGEGMKDYFWVTDMHPRMVMHPYRPDLVGQDLTGYRDTMDPSGKTLFVEFVAIVRDRNEGYLEYLWQWMDDASRIAPKLSYVRGVPHWGWIIGTGVYIHDVEEEIGRLTAKMVRAFGLIAACLLVVVLYVVGQSHRIEKDRLRAEAGLLEAKERYRALVEASNEGYLLLVEGDTIYSNHTLQRMLGYSEEELAAVDLWPALLPDTPVNREARAQLDRLLGDAIASTEFEAQAMTRGGVLLDVIMRASRIFFSQKNGHVVSIRKITSKAAPLESLAHDPAGPAGDEPAALTGEIEASRSTGHIIHTLNRLPVLVKRMTLSQGRSQAVRGAVCAVFEAVMRRFIALTLQRQGPVPAEFTFLTLGSNARQEMTLFSDQDNALIFANVPAAQLETVRLAFLKLADRICTLLDRAGYPFCPGGIMAVNPAWCLSLDEWKKRFTGRVENAVTESILDIHAVCDIRCIYGSEPLAEELKRHMIEVTGEHPEFLLHFARHCLTYQPPLTLFGRIRPEEYNGVETVNIKECLIPIVNFARIYALKNGVTEPQTLARLARLAELGVIQAETVAHMTRAFEFLWHLRFYNQIVCHEDLRRVNDQLDLESLTSGQRQALREILTDITGFQTRLSYDFLGVARI